MENVGLVTCLYSWELVRAFLDFFFFFGVENLGLKTWFSVSLYFDVFLGECNDGYVCRLTGSLSSFGFFFFFGFILFGF